MSSFFNALSAGQWIDLACAVFILIMLVIGAFRGFSGHLAHILGLAGSAALSFWLFPCVRGVIRGMAYFKDSPMAATIVSFAATLVLAVVLFLLLRMLLKRAMQLVMKQPFDAIFGIVMGALHAFLVLALVFGAASALPDCAVRRTFCESSRIGRWYAPVLSRVAPSICGRSDSGKADAGKR